MYSAAEIEHDNQAPPDPPPLPRCPICGEEVSTEEIIRTDLTNKILGCDLCIKQHFGDFLAGKPCPECDAMVADDESVYTNLKNKILGCDHCMRWYFGDFLGGG